jgi:3-oxoadipate enol-lactonase
MPLIDADGAKLNVEAEGPDGAPALVFSNSLGTDLHMWDDQAAALSKRYRVIRYDQRGHGKSNAPDGPYSMERLGRDVLAILDALEIPRAHFCGLSMGGMTGMWLGRAAPERIDRLVLANTAARSGTAESWNARIQAVNAKGVDGIADMALGIWFTKEFREREPTLMARMREMMVVTDAGGYVRCCAALRDMDQRWPIRDIALPTLIVAGTKDQATPVSAAELIQSRIAGSKLVALEAALISNIEQSATFTKTLEDFLKG